MELRKAAALCLGVLGACLWAAQSPLAAAAALGAPGRASAAQRRAQRAASAAAASSAAASAHGEASAPPRREPARKGAVVPHEYMLALYKSLSAGESHELNQSLARLGDRANTVTSFVDQGTDDSHPEAEAQTYVFNISSLPEMDEVVAAELRVFRRASEGLHTWDSMEGALPHLQLYTCPGAEGEGQLLDSRTADPSDPDTWEVFDVGEALKERSSGSLCLTLRVLLSDTLLPPAHWGFGRQERPPHQRALLVASSHSWKKENLFRAIRDKLRFMDTKRPPEPTPKGSTKHRRRRRTALATRPGRGHGKRAKTRCSRKPLHVNFKELGWDDWIIAPLDYEAHHCEGICDFPLRSHLEPTNHAIIQTLMNSMDPESTPPSCCVPSKLSPISILYIDSGNNVVYKQYEDMVVETCGCR